MRRIPVPSAVDPHRPDPEVARAADVGVRRVAHHPRVARRTPAAADHLTEDPRVGLGEADLTGSAEAVDQGEETQPLCFVSLVRHRAVRDHPETPARVPQQTESPEDAWVGLEGVEVLPAVAGHELRHRGLEAVATSDAGPHLDPIRHAVVVHLAQPVDLAGRVSPPGDIGGRPAAEGALPVVERVVEIEEGDRHSGDSGRAQTTTSMRSPRSSRSPPAGCGDPGHRKAKRSTLRPGASRTSSERAPAGGLAA